MDFDSLSVSRPLNELFLQWMSSNNTELFIKSAIKQIKQPIQQQQQQQQQQHQHSIQTHTESKQSIDNNNNNSIGTVPFDINSLTLHIDEPLTPITNKSPNNNNNPSSTANTASNPTAAAAVVSNPHLYYPGSGIITNELSPNNNKRIKSSNSLSPTSPTNNRITASASPPRSPQRINQQQSPNSSTNSNNNNSGIHSQYSASITRSPQLIRQFYFPDGIPLSPITKQKELDLIQQIFKRTHTDSIPNINNNNINSINNNNASLGLNRTEFIAITTLVCGFSSYCNNTLFNKLLTRQQQQQQQQSSKNKPAAPAAAALINNNTTTDNNNDYISESTFLEYYHSNIEKYDPHTRLFKLLKSNNNTSNNYLIRSDFDCLLSEIVNRHPGLEFLHSTPEFQFKYSITVIGRIFYTVNKSGTEQLTLRELKSSNFLTILSELDAELDINKLNDYFSYEHFYVIYCKFWELDQDHDGIINYNDLIQYEEYSLTNKIVQRIITGAGRKLLHNNNSINNNNNLSTIHPSNINPAEFNQIYMNYCDFIIFFISEVDKSSTVALDYWFNCCDLDSDGLLSIEEIEYFFTEQINRIQSLSQEQILFSDILCQLIDMIKPNSNQQQESNSISTSTFTKSELRSSQLISTFFNTLFNLNKLIQSEQRDPNKVKQIQDTPELSEWDRYAINSYYRLSAADSENETEMENESTDNYDFTNTNEEQYAAYTNNNNATNNNNTNTATKSANKLLD